MGTAWRAIPVQRPKIETWACAIAADAVDWPIFDPPVPAGMAG
jgi:hypothetical protein